MHSCIPFSTLSTCQTHQTSNNNSAFVLLCTWSLALPCLSATRQRHTPSGSMALLPALFLACFSAPCTGTFSEWRPPHAPFMAEDASSGINASTLIADSIAIMNAANNALLSTFDVNKTTINSRVVSPKPADEVTSKNATSAGLAKIYIDTNNLSRKYREIKKFGEAGAPVNLIFYDQTGVSYVAVKGRAFICGEKEAKDNYWSNWDAFYPNGSATPDYSLIRLEPNRLEVISASRFSILSGRADWTPPTLSRDSGEWIIDVPAVDPKPTPPPSPGPAVWTCTVCQHVYDPAKDGGGKAFEDLPDTWKCPVCGAPKSAYKKTTDGRWVHE